MSATKRGLILLFLVVILLAGVARVTLALHNHRALYDEVLVMEMADQLVKGQGYTLEFAWWPALAPDGWPQPDAQNRPLLPTLIAGAWLIFGKSVPLAAAVVAVVASLCVLVSFLSGWRAGGLAAGIVATGVVLINAHYLKETIFSLTSPVYGLFLALAFWVFFEALRARRGRVGLWGLLGLCSGLAWLARPEGPLILPALGLTAAYVWQRRRDSGGRRLIVGFVLAIVLFVLVASPLIVYNLENFGTPLHATSKINLWSWDYDARYSVTPPSAERYWATHTLADYVAGMTGNLVWMFTLLGDYLTWPGLVLLLIAAGLAVWRASPLTAIVVYTLVFLVSSLFQSVMSIWPGTQYFMYYSGILPAWAVLVGWGFREIWPALWATRQRRTVTAAVLTVALASIAVVEGAQMVSLVGRVGRSQTEVADPRLHDFRWMAEHVAPDAIVMTWDPENLHWYSNHRRAVMIPTDDAHTIQAFMQRFAVTHFYYNDWLVEIRPALKPLQQALRERTELGPYSVLQPVHVGEGILFEVDWSGPPAVLLVNPSEGTRERVAQTWLRYAVTDTLPADLSATPAIVVGDGTPNLAGRYQPVGARFMESAGGVVELAGYQVKAQDPKSNPQSAIQVTLTLYWRCITPVRADYTVFNHLLDAQGVWIAQQDGSPASGYYPTSWWQPGEVVVDRHVIDIPPDVQPGDYQIAVGLYDLDTLRRVPVQDGRDSAILTPITIGGPP